MRSRWLLIGLVAVLLLATGGAAALYMSSKRDVTTSSGEAYEAYREGVANEKRFYFKEARLAYARALELDPSFSMAMLGLARQAHDPEQQLTLIRRAAREKSRLSERERLNVEMMLAFAEKRRADGLQLARELHQQFPNDTWSAQVLAGDELLKGNADKAIRIFEELLAIDPNNAEAYNQIGYFYGYRGDYDKAVDNLKKYQFIAVDNANPFDSLGEVQAYSGRYNEAIENLNRALAIKPDFVESVAHLAVAHEGMGEYRKAIEYYEKASSIADNDEMRRAYLMRGMRAAHYMKDHAEILRLYAVSKTIKVAKGGSKWAVFDEAYAEAVAALASDRPAETRRILDELRPKLEEALKSEPLPHGYKPHFAGPNVLMALALEAQGENDEALEYWKKNANPPNPFRNFEERRAIIEARAKVAEALARKGDLDAAEKLIAENRKWNPSWAPTREAEVTVAELRRAKMLSAAK